MRWAKLGHGIIIGSRDPERARTKAAELRDVAHAIPIVGHGNADAAKLGDIVVVALPAAGLASTLPDAREACRGKVVVSTVVSLTFGGPRLFTPPAAGSSAEEVQALLPEARVVAAFHHIAAHELADAAAKETVSQLGRSMGLRVVDVGPLANAGPLEGITAVLATINRRYKLKNSGIKITGL